MALFGLPGGAEWMIIIGALVLLFVPGAAVFGFGYLLGRKNAPPAGEAPPAPPAPPAAPDEPARAPGGDTTVAASGNSPIGIGDADD